MHVTYWINSSYPELRQSKATLPRNVSVFTIRTGINIQEMARDKYYRITLAWCAGVRRRKFLFLIRRQNSLMRKQKIKQAKKRNEKKVVKETKKTRTDDAAFLVDLLLLPRWKRAMSLVSSMKDNPKIFFLSNALRQQNVDFVRTWGVRSKKKWTTVRFRTSMYITVDCVGCGQRAFKIP